jgi:hypothetical protein
MKQIASLGYPVFKRYIRENKRLHAGAGAEGVPVVMSGGDYLGIRNELEDFVSEFIKKLGI